MNGTPEIGITYAKVKVLDISSRKTNWVYLISNNLETIKKQIEAENQVNVENQVNFENLIIAKFNGDQINLESLVKVTKDEAKICASASNNLEPFEVTTQKIENGEKTLCRLGYMPT